MIDNESQSMTIDITHPRELEKAATPGPWAKGVIETDCIASEGGHGNVVLRRTNGGGMPTQSDLDLICEMRNALPAILAELEALRVIVKELAASECMATNEEATEYCIFCGRFKWSGCLISRAKELMK